jgi:hypothetical protein
MNISVSKVVILITVTTARPGKLKVLIGMTSGACVSGNEN